jgi:hypothetical protein
MRDAFRLADVLTSGVTGQELTERLQQEFAEIRRPDVFSALRFAVSFWQAELLEAELERDIAQRELEIARVDLALAQTELGWRRAQLAEMQDNGSWLKSPKSTALAGGMQA